MTTKILIVDGDEFGATGLKKKLLNRITQMVKQIEQITSRKSKASELEVTQNMYKIR